MSETPPEAPRQGTLRFNLPEEQKNGNYANLLAVWHSSHEFTLDFAITGLPQPTDPEDENSPIDVPCEVVARLKIPPTVIFDILRVLNENMTRYEAEYGTIQKPGERKGDAE